MKRTRRFGEDAEKAAILVFVEWVTGG